MAALRCGPERRWEPRCLTSGPRVREAGHHPQRAHRISSELAALALELRSSADHAEQDGVKASAFPPCSLLTAGVALGQADHPGRRLLLFLGGALASGLTVAGLPLHPQRAR